MYSLQLNSTAINPATQLGGSSSYILLIIIAIVLTFRLYRGLRGTKFSTFTLLRLPVAYTILTVLSIMFDYSSAYFYDMIIGALIVFVIGILVGLRYGGEAEFFEKDGNTHYKRAPYILIVWLVAFMARYVLEFAFPTLSAVTFAVNMLLSFSTGLIMGEALHIYEKYKKHVSK